MDVLNNCGLKNCGWCRETGGDRDRPGVVEDEGTGGGNWKRGRFGGWGEFRGSGESGFRARGG